MGARKKKQKRQQKKRRPGRQGPVQVAIPPNTVLVHAPPGEVKMSEVLLEFIEPYSNDWTTAEQLKKLLSVATIAWNAALLPASGRAEILQKMGDKLPPEDLQPMRAIIEEMIARKLTRFANNHRFILDYQVAMTPSGPHVTVMSSLDKK